ncbi:MAG: spermidine/putrescine ABC transporter substrate-binding protein [Oscillospiraceae bacterium]|jgi:spermidine/putrescine transport system substrate-binding protein|nr:spermidine/putrescine ABC transporter substrate-binding protein [Oscillospiraceae bacterium]
MKKLLITALALVLLVSMLAGCAGTNGGTGDPDAPASDTPNAPPANAGEVNVYNWGEYIDESLLGDFTDATGIRVNYLTFQSNEEMYAALKLGGTDYDVIIPSDYMISRLIAEDMLEKLDLANIPNLALVDPDFRTPEYDPTGEYSVTYMWGTVGLIYNAAEISEELTSWGALFDPAYKGQILMFNNPRDAFGIALKHLGYSLNTTDAAEIQAAYDLLAQQKPILQAYVMDQIFDKLENGEALLGPYYAGDYLSMKETNEDLRFVLPDEGSNVFSDAMCIPKNAVNKANAEAFINFITSTDAAVRNMEEIGYTSGNAEAAELYGADLDDADYAIQFPDGGVLARCEPFLNLPPETLALYDSLWVQLKS